MTEQEVEVEDTTEVETQEVESETPAFSNDDLVVFKKLGLDPDNASTADLLKVAKRALGAESTLVEQKRKTKELESQISNSDDYVKKSDIELDNFIRDNKLPSESREYLEKQMKKGNTLDEAKILYEATDKSIKNREKLKSSRVSDGVEVSESSSYSKDELANMSSSDYEKAIARLQKGTAKYRE